MLDCQGLNFSAKLAATRMAAAQAVLGSRIIKRVLAFSLYVLGVNRAQIADVLDIPPGTVRSIIRRLLDVGAKGFFDGRSKAMPMIESPPQAKEPDLLTVSPSAGEQPLVLTGGQIQLSDQNPIQRKIVLLSLIGDGMLNIKDVALILDLSVSRVRRLHQSLFANDIDGIVDKRRGQLKDYRVDSELKGQMIAQFILELAEHGSVSSAAVAQRLEAEGHKSVADRTIRQHLNQMGLIQVKSKLKVGLQAIKKTPDDNQ